MWAASSAPAAKSFVGWVYVRRRGAYAPLTSEALGVDADVLFAKLGGATAPHLSPIHGAPLAKLLSHTALTLAVPFLASFEVLRERKGSSGALRGDTRDQTAPEGTCLLYRALQPATDITQVAASGYYRGAQVDI